MRNVHYDKRFDNIGNIVALHEYSVDAPRLLSGFYGIQEFARYPIAVLKEMFDSHNETKAPYFLAIYARDDHNAAFRNQKPIKDLYEQRLGFNKDTTIKVLEVEGKRDLIRKLVRLKSRFAHRIPLMFVYAHGAKESINLGQEITLSSKGDSYEETGTVTKDDLLSSNLAVKVADKVLEAHVGHEESRSIIILGSCSTGQSDGIAETLQKITKGQVVAPVEDASMASIDIEFGDHSIVGVDVKYASHEGRAIKSAYYSN